MMSACSKLKTACEVYCISGVARCIALGVLSTCILAGTPLPSFVRRYFADGPLGERN